MVGSARERLGISARADALLSGSCATSATVSIIDLHDGNQRHRLPRRTRAARVRPQRRRGSDPLIVRSAQTRRIGSLPFRNSCDAAKHIAFAHGSPSVVVPQGGLRVARPCRRMKPSGWRCAGIVVRPMNDRQASRIVDHFAADLDLVAGPYRAARGDVDVVDHLEPSRAALRVERFVHRVRARAVEEARRRVTVAMKSTAPARPRRTLRQIHCRSHHARAGRMTRGARLGRSDGLDENHPNGALAAGAGNVGQRRTLWQLLQEPDLRDYQDLPEVDRVQFKRMVGARPTRLEPGVVRTLRVAALPRRRGRAARVGVVAHRRASRAIGGDRLQRRARTASWARHRDAKRLRRSSTKAFARLHLRELRAYCVPENVPSRAVLANVGFEEDGVRPRGATVGGEPVDVLGYVLDKNLGTP